MDYMNYYRLRADGRVVSDQDFRVDIHQDKMLPAQLSVEDLDSLGADPILASPMPARSAEQYAVRDGVVQDALGNWVQAWKLQDIPSDVLARTRAAAIDSAWAAIKHERDGSRVAGGVCVDGRWYHTDLISRMKWVNNKDSARDMQLQGAAEYAILYEDGSEVWWKTMTGEEVPVSIGLAYAVMSAIKTLDAQLFKTAELHINALQVSPNPANYDYMTGWPKQFGE